jgi:cytochrome c6
MHRRMVVLMALLAIGTVGMTGCKKKSETTEAPQTTTAPAQPMTTASTSKSEAPAPLAPSETGLTGEALFKQHCAACHPNGGNTINPSKPLGAKEMAKHGIATPEDIVKVMRHPAHGMTTFDVATISDKDARKIGEYVLKTFK